MIGGLEACGSGRSNRLQAVSEGASFFAGGAH